MKSFRKVAGNGNSPSADTVRVAAFLSGDKQGWAYTGETAPLATGTAIRMPDSGAVGYRIIEVARSQFEAANGNIRAVNVDIVDEDLGRFLYRETAEGKALPVLSQCRHAPFCEGDELGVIRLYSGDRLVNRFGGDPVAVVPRPTISQTLARGNGF
jgi:hypothetical protein